LWWRASGDLDWGIVRLTTSGALDNTFNGDGKRNISFDLTATNRSDIPNAVVIGVDGKISIGGLAYDGALNVSRVGLARLNIDGSFDTSFCATSCNFMSTYTTINNGRRVIYYGNDTPATRDSLVSMAINNATGELLTTGTTFSTGTPEVGYVQKFLSNGNWSNETVSLGGVAGSSIRMGGVHWANPNSGTSNVIITGASGPNQEFFFAQRFDSVLAPTTNWGVVGPSNSVLIWTGAAAGGFGDVGDDSPTISSIDSAGRVLVGGGYKVAATTDPYSLTVSRLTFNGAPPTDAVFKNSFE
jgi:Domain of unknown function (DUF5122) beta-propeller